MIGYSVTALGGGFILVLAACYGIAQAAKRWWGALPRELEAVERQIKLLLMY